MESTGAEPFPKGTCRNPSGQPRSSLPPCSRSKRLNRDYSSLARLMKQAMPSVRNFLRIFRTM
ncbi:MAG: hypothetical protein K6G18_01615, partial [Treponema sp.]|nr:hypothetical protein [Treponema sp.]